MTSKSFISSHVSSEISLTAVSFATSQSSMCHFGIT